MTDSDSHPQTPLPAPPRKRRIVRIALLIGLCGMVYIVWQTISIHRFGFQDDGRNADCAIILGTAAWHDKPSPVFKERLNHAIKLYKEGRVKALVLTGGYGKDAPFAESQVAKSYCLEQGVPESALFLEVESHTTAENLREAKKLLDEQKMKTALLVSDPWHLKRGVLIARRQGIDVSQSGTTTTAFTSFKSRSNFILRELYLYHASLVLD